MRPLDQPDDLPLAAWTGLGRQRLLDALHAGQVAEHPGDLAARLPSAIGHRGQLVQWTLDVGSTLGPVLRTPADFFRATCEASGQRNWPLCDELLDAFMHLGETCTVIAAWRYHPDESAVVLVEFADGFQIYALAMDDEGIGDVRFD